MTPLYKNSRGKPEASDRFAWDAESIETTRQMWKEGKSATEIAKVLGGVTRSAVCGKLSRLGLQRGGTTKPPKPRRPKPVKPRKVAADYTPRDATVEVLSPNPLTMLDLPLKGACRWIVDTEESLSCGNACGEATYCQGHHRMAYEAARARYTPAQVDWVLKRAERNRERSEDVLASKPWSSALWGRRA